MIRGAIIGVMAAALAWWAGLPRLMGAHPFWSDQVILVGAGLGLVVFAVSFRLGRAGQTLAALLLAAGAFGLASYGKSAFAASFAEDAAAGRLWYLGWHATCTFAVAAISAISAAR